MSNETKQVSIPLIRPGAESQILEMLRERAKAHEETIAKCEALTEKLENEERLTWQETELLIEALSVLAAKREDDLDSVLAGVEELEKVV